MRHYPLGPAVKHRAFLFSKLKQKPLSINKRFLYLSNFSNKLPHLLPNKRGHT